jgi:two-component system sensor histidine kinase CpxA
MRVVLVARSSSISGGGMIFDPRPWLAVGLGAVIFSLLFWLPLIRGITGSVSRMRAATREIARGRFEVRVNMRRRDELGALGESIDQMAARLDGFVRGQKRFLGDIAHELCSPLARLQMALGILEQRAQPGEASYVLSATQKAEQIATLVEELLSFSRASFGASAVHLRPVEVRAAAEEAVRREVTDGADIRLEIPANMAVAADPDLLVRALANLVRNALRHADSAGPVEIRAAENGNEVTITVSDSGAGVAEEELPRIFDAFYRLDAARTRDAGGSGLGLTIVKTCIESCCGSVTARNRNPRGLEVSVRLARAERLSADAPQ